MSDWSDIDSLSELGARLRRRLEEVELRIFIVPTILVILLWGFLEVADEVVEGDARPVDRAIMRAIHGDDLARSAVQDSFLRDTARELTALGSVEIVTLGVLLVVGYLLLHGDRREALVVLLSSIGVTAIFYGLKLVFDRPRPGLYPHMVEVSTPSFPSGHATIAAAIYLTIGLLMARFSNRRALKIYSVACGLLLAGIVGATRVLLAVHYPSDVLAGWSLGALWALLCWSAARALQRRDLLEERPLFGGEPSHDSQSGDDREEPR